MMTRDERRQRKAIRYQCFRIKNEREGGAKAPKDKKFSEQFEEDPWFTKMGGWLKFGVDWDISKGAPFSIVPLRTSLWKDWDEEVRENVIDLPRTKTKPINEKSARELSSEAEINIDIEI